jgi:hypothetical protein
MSREDVDVFQYEVKCQSTDMEDEEEPAIAGEVSGRQYLINHLS